MSVLVWTVNPIHTTQSPLSQEIISHLNSTAKAQDSRDPVQQIGKVHLRVTYFGMT